MREPGPIPNREYEPESKRYNRNRISCSELPTGLMADGMEPVSATDIYTFYNLKETMI